MEKSLKSYGTKEAAEFLRINSGTVCRRAARGELVGYKPGRRWVFLEEDLIAYLKSTQPYFPQLSQVHRRSISTVESPLAKRIKEERLRLRLEKRALSHVTDIF
jgi:excisionase family DNA binding protein